jgi:hypothetical protein
MQPPERLGDPVAFLGLGLGSPGHDLDRCRVVDGAHLLVQATQHKNAVNRRSSSTSNVSYRGTCYWSGRKQ